MAPGLRRAAAAAATEDCEVEKVPTEISPEKQPRIEVRRSSEVDFTDAGLVPRSERHRDRERLRWETEGALATIAAVAPAAAASRCPVPVVLPRVSTTEASIGDEHHGSAPHVVGKAASNCRDEAAVTRAAVRHHKEPFGGQSSGVTWRRAYRRRSRGEASTPAATRS